MKPTRRIPRRTDLLPFLAVCALILVASAASAQQQIFLQVQAFKGPSTDKAHNGWFELQESSDCVSNPSKIAFCEFSFSKAIDAATPSALNYLGSAKSVGTTSIIDFCDATGGGPATQQCFYRLQLRNARFTSRQMSHQSGGANKPGESWTLSFDAITWKFTDFGSGGSTTTGCWDLASNTSSCYTAP